MQLFQTADHVVILNEMVHDARIIPLDGGPHLPGAVPQWAGSSRGRWEGDTLVVESRNFSDKRASFEPSALLALGTGDTLRLTERFTRISDDTLLYEYTVDDPATFTRPFTAAVPMRHSSEVIYEYACHEGNYAVSEPNLLDLADVEALRAALAYFRRAATPLLAYSSTTIYHLRGHRVGTRRPCPGL